MNIDMRKIPEGFERNIREIMEERNVPATKALIWALEDRKEKKSRIKYLYERVEILEKKNDELMIFKETIQELRSALNMVSRE